MSYNAIPSIRDAAKSFGVNPSLLELTAKHPRTFIVDTDSIESITINLDYWRSLYGASILDVQVGPSHFDDFFSGMLQILPATYLNEDAEIVVAPHELRVDFTEDVDYLVYPSDS